MFACKSPIDTLIVLVQSDRRWIRHLSRHSSSPQLWPTGLLFPCLETTSQSASHWTEMALVILPTLCVSLSCFRTLTDHKSTCHWVTCWIQSFQRWLFHSLLKLNTVLSTILWYSRLWISSISYIILEKKTVFQSCFRVAVTALTASVVGEMTLECLLEQQLWP